MLPCVGLAYVALVLCCFLQFALYIAVHAGQAVRTQAVMKANSKRTTGEHLEMTYQNTLGLQEDTKVPAVSRLAVSL